MTLTPSGTPQVVSGSTALNDNMTIAEGRVVSIKLDGDFTVGGKTLTNNGTLNLTNGTTPQALKVDTGATLTNNGTLIMEDSLTLNVADGDLISHGTLQNAGNFSHTAGLVKVKTTSTIGNHAVSYALLGEGADYHVIGSTFDSILAAVPSGSTLTVLAGESQVVGSATVRVGKVLTLVVEDTLDMEGKTLTNDGDLTITAQGANGLITGSATAIIQNNGTLTVDGTVAVLHTGATGGAIENQTQGAITMTNGTVSSESASAIVINGGTASISGGLVECRGDAAAGGAAIIGVNAPGMLSVTANATVRGLTNGKVIVVSGSAVAPDIIGPVDGWYVLNGQYE